MQVFDRKENPLLDRVELKFKIGHDGKTTPSRDSMITSVAQSEPGAKRELIIIKNINTRFGMPLTTGTAYIYGSPESMTVEPIHALKRHGVIADDKDDEKPSSKDSPVATKDTSADDADDVEGGEE